MKKILLVFALLLTASAQAQETMKFVNQNPIITEIVVRRDRSKDAERKAAKEAFIGQQFTDVELEDVAGNPHKLSEYVGDGHWLLVDMWASWCGPCRRDMPNVVAAYEKYHDKGLNVIGISLDTERESWVQAITDLDMHWANLSDLKGWESIICNVYKTTSIPDNLLIDPQGKIVARELRDEALHNKLAEIFQ